MPEVFLQYKRKLIFECRKSGRLRLHDARKLLKIDVNKTRRIYDFLLRNRFIINENSVQQASSSS